MAQTAKHTPGKCKFSLKILPWDQVVHQFDVYIKGTALWLGRHSLDESIRVAQTPYSNYPDGEREIIYHYPAWLSPYDIKQAIAKMDMS